MTDEAIESIKIGDEWDQARLRALGSVLKEMGADLADDWGGHAGSQEVRHWDFLLGDRSVTVEAETYEGITVTGAPDLVQQIRVRVDTALAT